MVFGGAFMRSAAIFGEDLARGKAAEEAICTLLRGKMAAEHVRAYDFTIDGLSVELKADSRAPETGNFFCERLSNIDAGTIGGVDRALRDGVNLFMVLVDDQKNRAASRLICVEPEVLATHIAALVDAGLVKFALTPNQGYWTEGYLVPLPVLKQLAFYNCLFTAATPSNFRAAMYARISGGVK